jgi:hypothetical protein
MNAMMMGPAWRALMLPARRMRLRRKQLGFAMYEAERRPGLPARVANAHARFEHEARQAMRDWLML